MKFCEVQIEKVNFFAEMKKIHFSNQIVADLRRSRLKNITSNMYACTYHIFAIAFMQYLPKLVRLNNFRQNLKKSRNFMKRAFFHYRVEFCLPTLEVFKLRERPELSGAKTFSLIFRQQTQEAKLN